MILLAGCGAPRTIVTETGAVTTVPIETAFVSLGPGTPAVLSIVQTAYSNATRQTIALATDGSAPGQNELRVDIFGIANSGAGAESSLGDRPLTDEQLTSEAQTSLPGVPLRRSLTYVQNQYGPFGYALGRAAGNELCMYAWQRIATPDLDVSLFNRRATVSIRLRLCRPGATESSLVAAMMGLHVNASLSSGNWSQAPRPLSPDLGAAGAPMGPAPSAAVQAQPAPARAPKRRGRAPARTPAPQPAEAAPPVPAPSGSGVVIPPPPAAGSPGGGPVVPPPPLIPAPPQGTQP
ncbi:hypothetical protein LMIY3S_05722 [Labrys miyagiensis]